MGETGWGAITEAVVRKTKVCKGRSELPYECRLVRLGQNEIKGQGSGQPTAVPATQTEASLIQDYVEDLLYLAPL